MSEVPTVHQALRNVMTDVGAVRKDEKNQQQGWSFRGIDAVVKAVYPALVKHQVVVMPNLVDVIYSTVEIGQRKTPMGHCRVIVEYTFIGPAGDVLIAKVAAESMDSGDKATAKAMSVAFRTALLQSLCLPTDEPDPDHDIYERSVSEPAKKAPAKRTPSGPSKDDVTDLHAQLAKTALALGTDMEALTKKFRTENGGITFEEFMKLPAERIATFVRLVEQHTKNAGVK